MKIGIITCWQSLDNYGQQLQCFALQTLLRQWGHDAFLIRYAPQKEKKTVWQKVVNHFIHPKYILYHLPIQTANKKDAKNEKALEEINKKRNPERHFEQFRDKHLRMTPMIYYSYSDLQDNPPDADVYITGSDQVWYDSYTSDAAKGWFLQFGSNVVKRISYAASVGRIPNRQELSLFQKFLRCFDAISVRENSVRELCRQQGLDAQVCIDPTMLMPIEFYLNMTVPIIKNSEYAFLYVLNVKTADDFCWPQIKDFLIEEGLEVKSVSGSGYYQARELIENNHNIFATIPKWIGMIKESKYVFTTSFHGTVFSIMMHRPFLAIGLKGKQSHSNTRIEQLLSQLNIPERMLDPCKPIRDQMMSTINWESVDYHVAELKESSLTFLKSNLKRKDE